LFLGHFAAGLAAKKLTPYTSLGTLLLSAQLLDLIWPTLLLRGIEHVRIAPGITAVTPLDFVSYPWSHSLAVAVVWALLFSGIYVLLRRYPRGAIVTLALVLSHWVLDLVTHRPDLPLVPFGGPLVGLGLWYSLPATVIVEGVMFAVGLYLYKTNTEPVDKIGSGAFVAFVITLIVIYALSLFGPPPPDERTIAYLGHAQWLLVGWGYWLDRHRVAIRQW
jgi:FtsH-binding integral membrane protein